MQNIHATDSNLRSQSVHHANQEAGYKHSDDKTDNNPPTGDGRGHGVVVSDPYLDQSEEKLIPFKSELVENPGDDLIRNQITAIYCDFSIDIPGKQLDSCLIRDEQINVALAIEEDQSCGIGKVI